MLNSLCCFLNTQTHTHTQNVKFALHFFYLLILSILCSLIIFFVLVVFAIYIIHFSHIYLLQHVFILLYERLLIHSFFHLIILLSIFFIFSISITPHIFVASCNSILFTLFQAVSSSSFYSFLFYFFIKALKLFCSFLDFPLKKVCNAPSNPHLSATNDVISEEILEDFQNIYYRAW